MSKTALSIVYFALTFVAGAAVGSWALWIYLMGAPQETASALPPEPPAVTAQQPASAPVESAPAAPAAPAAKESETVVLKPAADEAPTPTPKGHWNTEDVSGRPHEECLARTKELNDAYKDCRFGSHKRVWVPEQ